MLGRDNVATAAAQHLTSVASEVRLQPAWLAMLQPQLEVAPSVIAAADLLLGFLAAADLRDASAGSLPPELSKQHDVRLDGSHLLQVVQVVDIAQPRVNDEGPDGEALENGSMDSAPRRGATLMKVVLSDGAQAICGIERKPISCLRVAEPGTKVVLSGGPLVRRGLLLLEPRHMEALGGNVARGTAVVPVGACSAPVSTPLPTVPAPIQAALAPALSRQNVNPPPPHVLCDIEDAPRPFSSVASAVTSNSPFPPVMQVIEPARHRPHEAAAQISGGAMMASQRESSAVQVAIPAVAQSQPLQQALPVLSELSEVTARFYVSDAIASDDGIWVRLCDGVGVCEAAIPCEVLQAIFPLESPDRWLQRTRMLHGFFEICRDYRNGQGLCVQSFSKSPLIGEVEEQLRCLTSA